MPTMTAPIKDTQLATCYHCGDPCDKEDIVVDDKHFCCQGCNMVYEILQENDLCNYYDLEKNPGISLKNLPADEQFAYLDSAEVVRQLLEFEGEDLQKLTLYIPAIHCSSCIWLLENLYQLKDGIKQSRVNFVKRQLTIGYDPASLSLRQVVELLASIGYEPHISLDNQQKDKQANPNRSLYIKIGVAGFSFGNIMLLSFPEYFGFEGLQDEAVQKFISYLNIGFALPVFFYCSSDYFLSAWSSLRRGFVNIDVPISLGILTLFGRSLYEILAQAGPGYLDSLAGLLFFLLIGKWFQQKTYDGLSFERDFKAYFPLGINKIIDGKITPLALNQVEVGDKLLIRNKELIPADSVLLSIEASIDYSFVTGESDPILRKKGNYLYAGGRLIGESAEVLVDKEVSQGYLTRLWNQDTFTKDNELHWQSMVDRIARYFTGIILFIAAATATYWYFVNPSVVVTAFTAVLIVACPCALALATPFTLGTAMSVFGRIKFYLKNASVIEKMSGITHVVFDKTGTITQNQKFEIRQVGQASAATLDAIYSLVSHSTHPLSRKLFHHLGGQQASLQPLSNWEEVEGKGLAGTYQGQPIKVGSAKYVGYQGSTQPQKNASTVYYDYNGEAGFFEIQNQLRPGFESLVQDLQSTYKLSLISGDHAGEREMLSRYFPEDTAMRFEQSPEDKLNYIRQLQNSGEKVLMIGDGLNDAGALKQSEVGVALTENISAFSPACDGILDANQFQRLGRFLRFARLSRHVIIASFAISFLYNVVGLSLAVAGLLEPVYAAILMPVSSITVVAFATVSIHGLAKWKKMI